MKRCSRVTFYTPGRRRNTRHPDCPPMFSENFEAPSQMLKHRILDIYLRTLLSEAAFLAHPSTQPTWARFRMWISLRLRAPALPRNINLSVMLPQPLCFFPCAWQTLLISRQASRNVIFSETSPSLSPHSYGPPEVFPTTPHLTLGTSDILSCLPPDCAKR